MSMSAIDQKKHLVGYTPALQRDRCGACKHAHEQDRFWSCRKHGLMVTVYAVCSTFEHRLPAAFKGPVPGG